LVSCAPHRKRGNFRIVEWIERPFYVGYVFVRLSISDVHTFNQCDHVVRVVGLPKAPIAIPDEIMAIIMAGADANGQMGSRDFVSCQRFEAAQMVKFRQDAPLAGLLATVLKDDGKTVRFSSTFSLPSVKSRSIPSI
jgi:transcription antitermination factor NusG